MKGKKIFTKDESRIIKNLLQLKVESARNKQKSIRHKLRRELNFHILDFDQTYQGFTKEKFELLIKNGNIKII